MDAEKSCPNCRAAMKLESKTPRFLSFECPKCAFVLIEVAKEDAPPSSARIHSVVHGGHLHNDYCFAEDGDADLFMRRFGGETFDPKQQGKRAQPGEVE
jgi:hypothetical protein